MKLFEQLRCNLGLKWSESEHLELQAIDEEIEQIPYNSPAVLTDTHRIALEHMRRKTIAAYCLGREAQLALDDALESNCNQMTWEKAYHLAQKTDDEIQTVLKYRLELKLSFNNSKDTFRLMFGPIGLTLIGLVFKKIFQINPDVFRWWMEMFIVAYITPTFLRIILSGLSEQLTSILVPRSTTQKVQDAALISNVNLWGVMPGRNIDNSNSLICRIINSVDNELELTSIGITDVPEEMCCAILLTPMTDPVGSAQSPHRFERKAILDWLKIRPTHPSTNLPLFPSELKRDYKLKLDIDRYVSEQLISKNVKQYKNKSSTGLSIFKPNTGSMMNNQRMLENDIELETNVCRNRFNFK